MYNKGVLMQYIAAISASSSIFVSGAAYGWTSAYLPKLQNANSAIPTTSDEGAWCAISLLIGSPFGSILATLLVDRIGRKKSILLTSPLNFVAVLILAFAQNIWIITACRVLLGVVDGYLFTVLPMYVGEICEPVRRGLLSSSITIIGILGALFINSIGPYTEIFMSSLITEVFPIVQLLIFVFMPESPYYLIKNKDYNKGLECLQILRGKNDVHKEFKDMCQAVERQECSNKAKFTDLFTVPSNLRATLIFIILCLASKFSGKTPIVFYAAIIFEEAGSSINPSLSVIVYNIVEVITLCITTLIIDKFGKKILLSVSTLGCILSLAVLATHIYLKEYAFYPSSLGWIPLLALILYNILYSIGLSFGQVTVLSELFPTNIKGVALGSADIFSVLMAAVSSKYFQVTKDSFGMHVPFYSYSLLLLVLYVFIIKYVPETKGKSLEEIQQYLINTSKSKKVVLSDSVLKK